MARITRGHAVSEEARKREKTCSVNVACEACRLV